MPIPRENPEVERKSLRHIAAERIKAAIFDGSFEPGERLNDQELQDWLGISRTPVREALNDLARVGLVEMAAQRYTRVAKARPEDRTDILQTLGALVGGVVRVTVPLLTDAQREGLLEEIAAVIALVEKRDTMGHGARAWAMVDMFIVACPNDYLVRATRDSIDALAYQLAVTRTETSTTWDRLDEGYPRLHSALIAEDAVAAELAIETVFRL